MSNKFFCFLVFKNQKVFSKIVIKQAIVYGLRTLYGPKLTKMYHFPFFWAEKQHPAQQNSTEDKYN